MNPMSSNPTEVAEAAMQFELEGRKILIDAGQKAQDPLSKATFQFLADQELKHIEAIKAFAASLAGEGKFDPSALQAPLTKLQAREGIKGIFAQFQSKFEATAGQEHERQEVYKVAMDMERRGHDFYESSAERSTDDTSKKLFKWLTGEETNHFEIIQETAEFLKQPDAIMAVQERWMQF
jgi:rubrerythrin